MRLFIAVLIAFAAIALTVTPAFATSTGSPGQPGQSCGSATAGSSPGGGNSSVSSGSPFQGASSADVYANPGTTPAGGPNAGDSNPNAVSQYDVACFQVSQPH